MGVHVRPEDVAAGWRPLSDAEAVTVEGLSVEAMVILGVEVPDLDARDDAVVRLVAVKMIRRVLKNPDGYRVRSESIDDYADGGTIDSALSTGELYVSEKELAWLGILPEASTKRAFEIRLGGS